MSNLSIQALQQRKSHSQLGDPFPGEAEIRDMLAVACTVPDHGRLQPYRFIVIGPNHKRALAQAFRDSIQSAREEAVPDAVLEKVAAKADAAPLQVYLVFSPLRPHRIPEWEQFATASCTGYALTLAAEALGYSAIWKSFAYSDQPAFRAYLGLAEHEQNLGWVNLGSALAEKPERPLSDESSKIELRL